VLSTLHTNDSPSVITRLLEMRIESYLISSSLLASMAQRLVRTVCSKCRTNFYPSKEVLKELGLDEDKQKQLFKGKGCKECFDSGFKGRIGIYELLEMDDGLQNLISNNPTIDTLQNYLKEKGYRTLREFGYNKVLEGLTTIGEVRRVTSLDT
jgi:type II secretory ATPase GspE/PulE/Tfp pilus assembly ATPase PilB-like protein